MSQTCLEHYPFLAIFAMLPQERTHTPGLRPRPKSEPLEALPYIA